MNQLKSISASLLLACATIGASQAADDSVAEGDRSLLLSQGYGWQSQQVGTGSSTTSAGASSATSQPTGTTGTSNGGQSGSTIYAQLQQSLRQIQASSNQTGADAGSQMQPPGTGFGAQTSSTSGTNSLPGTPPEAGLGSPAAGAAPPQIPGYDANQIPAAGIRVRSILDPEPPDGAMMPGELGQKEEGIRGGKMRGTTDDTGEEAPSTSERAAPRLDTPMRRAVGYLRVRNYPSCLSELDQVLRTNPRNAQAHYMKGVVYVLTRHYSQAAQEYNKVVADSPNSDVGKLARNGLAKLSAEPALVRDTSTIHAGRP